MCEVTKYLMFAREFFGNKNGKHSNQINCGFQKLCKTNIHRNALYKYGTLLHTFLNLFSAFAKLMIDAKILVKTSEEL